MNLVVVLVPVVGIEFARLYERTLLDALERDMRHQAALAGRVLEEDLTQGRGLDDPSHERFLSRAAEATRMRIRVVDAEGRVIADSHASGPPEGPEPEPPSLLPSLSDAYSVGRSRANPGERWPPPGERREVRDALAGHPSAYTRVRARHPAVLLFVTEPIRREGEVVGAVYVVRSTQPVLVELYRIRRGLYQVLGVALFFTLFVTLALAFSISRPLSRLSRAAKRIARGERDVPIPVGGGGEIRELGEAFDVMTDRLDERMKYISDFAADVAHEFKSPLTSIRGAAELLAEGAADDPEARARFLRNIELDTQRLDRLVSRLLELSRIEASDAAMSTLDLEGLLARAAKRADSAHNAVRVRYDADARMVRGRTADLETAVLNLLDNALRHSPEGADVDVTAQRSADALVVTVRDRGPGIPDASLGAIFDRFFTTDAEGEGTGLGLAIVKSVIEAHGGAVAAANHPDGGAVFTLTLPLRAT